MVVSTGLRIMAEFIFEQVAGRRRDSARGSYPEVAGHRAFNSKGKNRESLS